jgi:hypothetical protein
MHTDENKATRDYSHEYKLRKKSKKRMIAEIEKEKALLFEAMLKEQNITFSNWINKKINDHISEVK